MERMEMAKKLFSQAQKMTIGMAGAVFVYGAAAYYLVTRGEVGPPILDAKTYSLVKYGALAASIMGIFAMWQLSNRMSGVSQPSATDPERHPRKLFVGTIIMSAGAELPVLLGMVLVFVGHQIYDYIPFAVISLTGFAFAFPQRQKWSDWLGSDL